MAPATFSRQFMMEKPHDEHPGHSSTPARGSAGQPSAGHGTRGLELSADRIYAWQGASRAVGFCYSFSRLSTAVTSILIGIILQYAGTPGVISFIVVSMLMVMLSVGIFGPRTRGIRLENI